MSIRATTVLAVVVVSYVVLYEWGLFEADAIWLPVTAAKVMIPLLLLLVIPLTKSQPRRFALFVLFSIAFMLWGLIPSLLSTFYEESITQWLKFLSRVVFSLLVGIYFLKKPEASAAVTKLLVLIGVFTVLQFFLLVPSVLFGIADVLRITGTRGAYYGPFGILGNQVAAMHIAGFPVPVLRLTGYWLEPSKASGFLFAAFFLSRAVYSVERKALWRFSSYLCLTGGFLALSNAGYLAIATATLFGIVLVKKSSRNIMPAALTVTLSIGLVFFVFAGRVLVAERAFDNPLLRAVAGVRLSSVETLANPYGGRLETMNSNVAIWRENPFGIGFRIPGDSFFEEASGSAPIMWMSYTGFIGLIFLMLRDSQVLISAMKYSRYSEPVRRVSQAWVALFTQHLVYGSWFSPMYLLLCVLVISTAIHARRSTVTSSSTRQLGAEGIIMPRTIRTS